MSFENNRKRSLLFPSKPSRKKKWSVQDVDRIIATVKLCEIALLTNHHKEDALRSIAELCAEINPQSSRVWKCDVIDEESIPREFLSLDKEKVAAYLRENKGHLSAGPTRVGGLRFQAEETAVAASRTKGALSNR